MSLGVADSTSGHGTVANPSFLPPETESAVPATVTAAEPAAAPTTGKPAAPLDHFLAAVTDSDYSITTSKASAAEPPTPSPNGGELPSPAAALSPGWSCNTEWNEAKPSSTTSSSAAAAAAAAPDSNSAAAAAPPACRIDVGVTLQRARHSLAGHRDGTWLLHDTTAGLGGSQVLCLSVKESGSESICWQGSITKTDVGFTLEDDSGLPGQPFATLEQLVVHFSTHRYSSSSTTTLQSQLHAGHGAETDGDSARVSVSGPPDHHGGDGGVGGIRPQSLDVGAVTMDLPARSPTRSMTIASHRGLAKGRLNTLNAAKQHHSADHDVNSNDTKQITGGTGETSDDIPGGTKMDSTAVDTSTAIVTVPTTPNQTHIMLRGPAIAGYFVIVYFIIGVLFYTQQMDWDVDFTLYFIVIIITTVGYGDHEDIETDGQKLFTAAYVFVGVALVMTSITLIIAAVQRKRAILKAKVQKRAIEHILQINKGSQQAGSASLTSSGKDDPPTPGGPVDGVVLGSEMNSSGSKPKGAGKQRDPSKDRPSRSEQIQHAIWNFSRVYPICRAALFVVVGALIGITWGMQSDEEWTFVEALYWVVITGTTVGFGDYHPTYSGSYWFAIFYIFALVIVMGNLLNNISERLIYGDVERHRVNSKQTDSVLHEELQRAQNAAGSVDKAEWLRAVLVALGQVDPVLCDIILSYFDKLDYDADGLLTSEELERAIERTPLPEAELDKLENSVGYLSALFSQLDYVGVHHRDSVQSSTLKIPERRIGMRKGMGF